MFTELKMYTTVYRINCTKYKYKTHLWNHLMIIKYLENIYSCVINDAVLMTHYCRENAILNATIGSFAVYVSYVTAATPND